MTKPHPKPHLPVPAGVKVVKEPNPTAPEPRPSAPVATLAPCVTCGNPRGKKCDVCGN